ncbi:hypothetical protein HPB47_024843 [Ixodes persulcatus]|uniref:Uncharacterized protein n=1 Tax=Ixodes persulcatus TaxID=34615 RepID=A0AC60Q394_IXOPE|nr:hypothetical protein HPB47_024843 [Ixodes persulcatus]
MILADSQPVVHTSSPRQAFKLVFFAHFVFNIVYRKETSLCLEFMQRWVAASVQDAMVPRCQSGPVHQLGLVLRF